MVHFIEFYCVVYCTNFMLYSCINLLSYVGSFLVMFQANQLLGYEQKVDILIL
jgi:hypothetical protein